MNTTCIALCGFMGCGKTTVGKILAKKLGYEFVDLDTYIASETKMNIPEIFEKYGETVFSDIEHNALLKFAGRKKTVLATGGGVVTFERNVRALKENSTIVFIDVSLPVLYERLKSSTTRPLIAGENAKEKIKSLYNERYGLYKSAAHIIISGNDVPSIVAGKIAEALDIQ